MLKAKIIGLLLILICKISYTQVTENPKVSSFDPPNCTIEKVRIEGGRTYVDLLYEKTKSFPYQAWISFASSMYIKDKKTGEKYNILGLGNDLSLDTQYKTDGKKGTIYEVTLVFPVLPAGITSIDIIEPAQNGFMWYGVEINNPKIENTYSSEHSPDNKRKYSDKTNEKEWKEYFDSRKDLDPIEGIWLGQSKLFFNAEDLAGHTIDYDYAVVKEGEIYQLYQVSDGLATEQWHKTAASNGYLYVDEYDECTDKALFVMVDNIYTNFQYETCFKPSGSQSQVVWEWTFIKTYPINNNSVSSDLKTSGTGFALSKNGYIVTNYHVVEGASGIKIKGVNNNFNTSYDAKVVVTDKRNDIAIIEITDPAFTSLNNIPYTIIGSGSKVGENVFALGYPLRSTMGDEIKLTNGIISSNTGFQGDVTSYQVSVPVQPGNSGGPLFDANGNVIGIINAKHTQAENASYAIKVSYLLSLLELLPKEVVLNNYNTLKGKSLSEQVEIVKQFVYIIEVY
jgi:S1-C subfamily serine protease